MNDVCFVYSGGFPDGGYSRIINTMVDPIMEYLPEARKVNKAIPGALNIRFFVEHEKQGAFMSHGIADKNWRTASKLKGFEYVFVSGSLWKEKLIMQGFPADRIFMNGYTKMDPIFQGKIKPQPHNKPIVLWAPTHNAIKSVSSYPALNKQNKLLPDCYTIISSLHPCTSKGDPTMQLLANADVVIADCGSTLYEAWALGKPVIFPDWLVRDGIYKYFPGSFEEKIYKESIDYHAQTPAELPIFIEQALHDGIKPEVKRFIDGIFPPELRGKSGEATAKILKELSAK